MLLPRATEKVNTGDFGTRARHLPRKRDTKLQPQDVLADTAVRPYAEISEFNLRPFTHKVDNARRGGMFSGRAGRRKCCYQEQQRR